MREVDLVFQIYPAAVANTPSRTRKVTEAIYGDNNCVLIGGHKEGRCEVSEMVFDIANFRSQRFAGERSGQFFFDRRAFPLVLETIEDQRRARTMQSGVPDLAPEIRSGILVDRDHVKIGKAGASCR